jgi:hypothetical protein
MPRVARMVLALIVSYVALWALTAALGVGAGRARALARYGMEAGPDTASCTDSLVSGPLDRPWQTGPCFAIATAPAPLVLRVRYGAVGVESGRQIIETELWLFGALVPLRRTVIDY